VFVCNFPSRAVAAVLAETVDLKLMNVVRCSEGGAGASSSVRADACWAGAGSEQAVSRRQAALVAAKQAESADRAQLKLAEQQFNDYEGRGCEVLDDPAYLAAERAHTAASAAWTQSPSASF
jgi:hypothetical protein